MTEFLSSHPQVFMPEKKELHYFGCDLALRRRSLSLDEYLSYFAEAESETHVGEASVWYLFSETAAAEIKDFRSDAKIIVMLRNPVDMLYSLHSQMLFSGNEDIADFEDALAAESARRQGMRIPKTAKNPKGLLYHDVVRYVDQIERYINAFGGEQVHVLLLDDMKQDIGEAYRGVCRFLGVDESFSPNFRVINPNKRVRSRFILRMLKTPPPILRRAVRAVVPSRLLRVTATAIVRANTSYETRTPISNELRAKLQDEFSDEVRRLEILLGRDLSHWMKP